MPVKFTGSHYDPEWVETGFYSLDIALRKNYTLIGWPTRTLTHIYGPTSTGKSTFINSISAVLGRKLDLNIACLDLEPQDAKTIESICENLKFENEWRWIEPDKRQKDKFSDENMLKQLRMTVKDGYITILDSVASIAPVAEVQGGIGDANMGRRAFPMAQYSRLINRELKYSDKGTVSFMANHRYEKIATGLAFATYQAPGGAVKKTWPISILKIKFLTSKLEVASNLLIMEMGGCLKARF